MYTVLSGLTSLHPPRDTIFEFDENKVQIQKRRSEIIYLPVKTTSYDLHFKLSLAVNCKPRRFLSGPCDGHLRSGIEARHGERHGSQSPKASLTRPVGNS